jgi:hypothetical protein
MSLIHNVPYSCAYWSVQHAKKKHALMAYSDAPIIPFVLLCASLQLIQYDK